MRILIAPDKFKGTLTQREAAAAIRRGVERAARERGIEIEVDECPVADGGEGTLDAITSVGKVYHGTARAHEVSISGIRGVWISHDHRVPMRDRYPTFRRRVAQLCLLVMASALFDIFRVAITMSSGPVPIGFASRMFRSGVLAAFALYVFLRVRYGLPPNQARNAFIEAATVIGLSSTPLENRDPEGATSERVGDLIFDAIRDGCGTIFVGLGGTASVDGGIGAADALGFGFFDQHDELLVPNGSALRYVRQIRRRKNERRLRRIELIALCDVQNPLLGPRGAARMFGPQKGATPEQVERLEAGLENLVRVCKECNIPCDPDQPGAGAAGGLGFGLATFLGAKLVPGAPYILDLLNFDERCRQADLVITGEGKMDMQTAEGKACAEVAKRAERAGKPCIAVVGTTEGEPADAREQLAARGIHFRSISRATDPVSPANAEGRDHAQLLADAAYTAFRAAVSN